MLRFITKNVSFTQLKLNRQMSVVAASLKYTQHGEPAEVLTLCKDKIEEPTGKEVIIKILVSPINPADINIIQGKYPVKPQFPAIAGNECVAEVVCVGPDVTKFAGGDRVIPFVSNLGVWTSFTKVCEDQLMKVSKKIGLVEAATLTVNPCTAYRMLNDFVKLKSGDTVIQNAANSGVGLAVHQLCKAWGICSVGVVRNRPDIDKLKKYMKEMGATEVLTEEEIRTTKIFKTEYKKPALALNGVGGKSAVEVSRHLVNGGVMVTYGGMSRDPVTVPTGSLIFKDLVFKGFWLTRWTKENADSEKRRSMFEELTKLIEEEKFKAPAHELVPLDKYKDAMNAALNFKGFSGKKFILDFQKDF